MKAAIRIGTWNMREGVAVSGSRENGHGNVIAVLDRSELDVLALQEVDFTSEGRSAELEAIVENTDLKHACTYNLGPSSFHPARRSGLAVVSRAPHSAVARVAFPNPNLRYRTALGALSTWDKGMLVVRIKTGALPVWVASVHCYPFHKFARDARDSEFGNIWRSLADELNRLAVGPTVVSGDFNTKHLYVLTERLDRRMKRAIDNVVRTGDEILYGSELTMRKFAITETFSDHPLCSVEFALEGNSRGPHLR